MSTSADINAALYLFLKTLYDFGPYLQNPDEQEKLINIPTPVKIVLREIIRSKIFCQLIIDNEYKKAEEKRKEKMRRKEERERQLIEGIKPVSIEDENYENNLKLLKNKRSINTSCFNQRSISTLNHYYNSVNEMLCIKDTVINKIKRIEHESVISCVELETKNQIVHDKFIFMNPKNKNKFLMSSYNKSSNDLKVNKYSASNLNSNIALLSRGFMSLDNYYKFIKDNLNKLNSGANPEKTSKSDKKLKLKKEEEKKKERQKNRFRVYTTDKNNKNALPVLKNKTGLDFIRLNKDVNYQLKKYNLKKKNMSKDKQFMCYTEFDYKNILSLFK